MEKRYYWLKLQSDFFGSLRVKKLRKMKRGDTMLLIYLKLQLSTLCKDGVFEYKGIEDDISSELALDLGEKVADVRACLAYLFENGMCEKVDETHYVLPWVTANTGSETASTQRWRDWKSKQSVGGLLESNTTPTDCQRTANAEKEIEKEIDIELEKEKENSAHYKQWIKEYPLGEIDPKETRLAWDKLKVDETMFAAIMDGLRKWKRAWDDPKFIPYPATWLNNRRWECDPPKRKKHFSYERDELMTQEQFEALSIDLNSEV